MKEKPVMPKPELMRLFVNSLQLCLKTPIAGYKISDHDVLRLSFKSTPQNDQGFEYFIQLVDGIRDEKKKFVVIKNFSSALSTRLVNFLALSRLREKNMITLANLDNRYQPYVQKLFGPQQAMATKTIEHSQNAVTIVFSHVASYKITLRELSQKSGLTQAALSNFKSGSDIRLSSLIKILKALGLRLTISQ